MLARVALDPSYPELELREAIFAAAGSEHNLEVAVTAVSDLTRPPEDHVLRLVVGVCGFSLLSAAAKTE
ncbi:MAG: hypothetical protein JOZ81_26325 [Chloroflexi bacterium]|nr:hypothetical protein [Chloroflexota bacterium]